jgi:hypothetical protein
MTKAEQLEAAEVLQRVVDRPKRGNAPGWYRERLVGAMLANRLCFD